VTESAPRKGPQGWVFYALFAGALSLALAGGVVYLASDSDLAWWLGGAAVLPLLVLAVRIQEGNQEPDDDPSRDSGPWAPP
jgi:hypothetical protein